jgi:predicted DsbA family dithiol-disulfide isomerase
MTRSLTGPTIRLDIFSDPVCPWCFICKANLDRALADHPGHPFVIQWHPFQLNPDMPPEGADKRAYLAAKFGGGARLDAMTDRLREVARAAGVDMDPDRPQRMPNTLDAHRLIHWAGIEGRQADVVDRLMRAYWSEGRDIGTRDTLADIAGEAGMDRTATMRLLQSDADADDIAARDADARQKGVSSVPTFLIAQQYVVTGAQPPDLWGQVIADLTPADESRLN